MEWPQSWARRLEFVLNDRPALDAFHDWLKANHQNHPLELHFALRSFERMAKERNERATELAQIIYETYISARTGLCSFFPSRARNEVALRVRNLAPDSPADATIFEPLAAPLENHLRELHEAFVSSDHFIDAFNQFSLGGDDRRRRKHSEKERYGTQLTAETLLMSRDVREHAESSVERMFACPARPPYVGRATTSQNDSAVSSSFSGDGRHRLRSIREEQLRTQPQTFTVPRVDQWRENDAPDHATEEGRRHFAEKLAKRLQKEYNKRRRNDDTERQLRDIADRKCTAREAITDFAQDEDEDEDLDRFLERMGDVDSVKGSAQRSPRGGALLSPSEWRRELPRSVERREMTNSFSRQPPAYTAPQKDRSRQVIYDSSGIESNAPSGFSNASRTSRSSAQRRTSSRKLLTISYKGPDGVPVVAHVPPTCGTGTITLRDFRRQFSISSHDPVQFFFKTYCEDGSAPYQLLLVTDDSQPLPLFDGRVSAVPRARSFLDQERA